MTKKILFVCFRRLLFLTLAFLLGSLAGKAELSLGIHPVSGPVLSSSENWGLSFPEEGTLPTANASIEELKQYDAYYAQDTDEKILYLTFDCGYENGATPAILDALKKHQAPAAFFVVGNFVRDNPDLIRRMTEEGHTVANHTLSHPDMSKISSVENFQKELSGVESLYKEITGTDMIKYYRPPQGIYSTENLKMAQQLGYQTFFWSLAYVDWQQDDQPTHEEAFDKLLSRVHPGAVVLLHNTSKTNGEIMEELLSNGRKWDIPSVRCPTLPKQHKIEKGQLPIRLLSFFIRSFTFYFWL